MGALIAMVADMARSAIRLILGPVMQDVIGEAVVEEEAISQTIVTPLARVDLAVADVAGTVEGIDATVDAIAQYWGIQPE